MTYDAKRIDFPQDTKANKHTHISYSVQVTKLYLEMSLENINQPVYTFIVNISGLYFLRNIWKFLYYLYRFMNFL